MRWPCGFPPLLSGPLLYVECHISVEENMLSTSLFQTFSSFDIQ